MTIKANVMHLFPCDEHLGTQVKRHSFGRRIPFLGLEVDPDIVIIPFSAK